MHVRPHSADNMREIVKDGYDIVGQEHFNKDDRRGCCAACCSAICRCVRAQLCILFSVGAVVGGVAGYAGFTFVRKPSRLSSTIYDCNATDCELGQGNLRTPGNMTHSMSLPSCASPKLKQEMAKFNADHRWKLVDIPSRQGLAGQQTVILKAWWLPLKDPRAPRIVIMHGSDANFNDYSVQVTAYLLRSIGFAVLLPSFRDHGASGASEHGTIGWGWDYHLDVLGAWDFALKDPDGTLGGALEETKVGLMGFGLGAFATAIALGMEKRVPAAWLDSAIVEPREMLRFGLARLVGPFAPLFTGPAWYFANRFAGVNLTHRTPAATLPQAQSQVRRSRYVAVSHDRLDASVPQIETDELVSLLSALTTYDYSIEERYLPHAIGCGGEARAVLPVWRPDTFRRKLCEFWSGVFGRFAHDCGLDLLPKFDDPLGVDSLASPQRSLQASEGPCRFVAV